MEHSTHPREGDAEDDRSVRRRVGDTADTADTAAAAAAAEAPASDARPPSFAVSGGAAHTLAVGLQDGKPRLLAFGWDCRRQCGLGSSDVIVEYAHLPACRLSPTPGLALAAAAACGSAALRTDSATLPTDREERQKFIRALKPTAVARLGNETVVCVAAGGGALTGHSAAACASGKLYTWGRATEGQLGHGPAGNNTVVAAPRLVSFPEPSHVVIVAAAADHTAALTTQGVLYTFGTDANKNGKLCHQGEHVCKIPRKVAGGKFTSVSCGLETTAVVTDTGAVLMCGKLPTVGSGVDRALEWHDAATLEPVALPVRVAQVSCGSQHFAALGTAGEVYTWGAGNYGKLGLGGRDDVAGPSLVRGQLEGKTSRAVSCGDHHSAVISSAGELLTWGRGAQGRLGHGDEQDVELPKRVVGLKPDHWSEVAGMPDGAVVASVSCGFSHTALVTTAGDVCSFGYGIFGQLGYGYRDNIEAPVLVAGPSMPTLADV